MSRIPYEVIAPIANKLVEKAVSSSDLEEVNKYWDEYNAVLEGAGWSAAEFDAVQLSKIDKDWDEKPIIKNKKHYLN